MEVRPIPKDEKIIVEGTISEAYPRAKVKVDLQDDHEIIGYTSGKMRKHNIRILLGDRVRMEISPYDLTRGRIVYRYRRHSASPDQDN